MVLLAFLCDEVVVDAFEEDGDEDEDEEVAAAADLPTNVDVEETAVFFATVEIALRAATDDDTENIARGVIMV